MLDRELALKHWKACCRKLGKHKQFHYVAVIEEQARGALHFHVAVAGRQMYALQQGILGRGPNGEQMGQVHSATRTVSASAWPGRTRSPAT